MKTKFERFSASVLARLKKLGVDTTKNLGNIMSCIADYFDETDPAWAAQCIKFELERGFTPEKIRGIREATEGQITTDIDKNEDFEEFVDQVLDELDKRNAIEVYDYYTDNREELVDFMGENPSDVANELIEYFDETGEEELDPEERDERRWAEESENDSMRAYNDASDIAEVRKLQELHKSGEVLKNPTGADGQWATESFPISYAISQNDVATLEEYFENGIPARLISGDEDDTEIIDWEDEYSQEFEQDYSLLTKEVALGGSEINNALDFMIDNVDHFIVSPYDLYNLFVAKETSDATLQKLIDNYYETMDKEERFEPVSYFDPATILDLRVYISDVL